MKFVFNDVPVIAPLTAKFVPIFTDPPIPTPPRTTRAPDDVEVDGIEEVNEEGLVTDTDPNVDKFLGAMIVPV